MTKQPPVMPWSSIDTAVDDDDIMAIKALAAGKASEGQQKRALDLIIYKIASTYDMSFRPGLDGERATCFAEGKRHVGNQIIRLMKLAIKSKP